jgi:hypothetical protein
MLCPVLALVSRAGGNLAVVSEQVSASDLFCHHTTAATATQYSRVSLF